MGDFETDSDNPKIEFVDEDGLAESIIDFFQEQEVAVNIYAWQERVTLTLTCGQYIETVGVDLYNAATDALRRYLQHNHDAIDDAVAAGLILDPEGEDEEEDDDDGSPFSWISGWKVARTPAGMLHQAEEARRQGDFKLADKIRRQMEEDAARLRGRGGYEEHCFGYSRAHELPDPAVVTYTAPHVGCQHEIVDTGMRKSWCKKCDVTFKLAENGEWGME